MLSSLYAIRRHGTSTRPWSSTSPSTSSCRWFSARRWCTPTTSSSSRWTNSQLAFGKNAFQARSFFRTVTLTGTTRTPTRAQPLASPAPRSGGKISSRSFKGAPGRHLNWPASQRLSFYGREIFSWHYGKEILQTVQKSPSHREDEQRAKANRISFMSGNIENVQTKPWHWPHILQHGLCSVWCPVKVMQGKRDIRFFINLWQSPSPYFQQFSFLISGLAIRFFHRLMRGGQRPTGESLSENSWCIIWRLFDTLVGRDQVKIQQDNPGFLENVATKVFC